MFHSLSQSLHILIAPVDSFNVALCATYCYLKYIYIAAHKDMYHTMYNVHGVVVTLLNM